jgi:hypothetical protein
MHLLLKALPLTLVALASSGLSQTLYSSVQSTASGSLNGVPFASTPFTISVAWDVAAVQLVGSNIYSVDHSAASIEITGLGTYTFTTATRTFNNQNVPVAGFSRASGADLVNGPYDQAFASWNLATPIGPLVGTANIIQWGAGDIMTSGGVLILDNASSVPCTFVAGTSPGGVGTNYCGPAVPNSTGSSSRLQATGTAVVANNDLTLVASDLPLNSFGFFLTSRTQGSISQPGGSQGLLCLGGSIGRYVGPGQIRNSGTTGSFSLLLNLAQTPTPAGFVAVVPGETWNFQGWHRDAVGGVPTSNFTDGLRVQFN